MYANLTVVVIAVALIIGSQAYSGINEVLYPENSVNKPATIFPFGGHIPSPRVFSSIAAINDKLVVFGGYASDGSLLDDVNIYDINSHQWSNPILKRQCCNFAGDVIETIGQEENFTMPGVRNGFEGDLPAARAEHTASAVTATNLIYVFGGKTDDYGLVQDLYTFDPVMIQWNKLSSTVGDMPCRRAGHSAVAYGSGFYIFGGRSTLNYGLNDVWQFDALRLQWNAIGMGLSNAPAIRQHAAMAIYDTKLFVFGGIDPASSVTYNDLWQFDLNSRLWTSMSSGGDSQGFAPPSLFHAHLIVDHTGLLIYGGVGGGGSCGGISCNQKLTAYGQLYKFSFSLWDWAKPRLYTGQRNPEDYTAISLEWNFARLTTSSVYKGRLRKLYGLEEVYHLSDRNMIVELGGLQAVPIDLVIAYQHAGTVTPNEATSLDLGGALPFVLWDLETQEHLRTRVDVPSNGPWVYTDAFTQSQPQLNFTKVAFVNQLRYFVISDEDVILVKTENS